MKGYLIRQHERCIQVLDAIDEFNKRKRREREWIDGFAGTFPRLRQKYFDRILILEKCIERMELLYNKEKSKL